MKLALLFSLVLSLTAVAGNDPLEEQLNQLRGVLAGFKGTTVRTVGNVALVEGELEDAAELEKLNAVVHALQPTAQQETKLTVQTVATVSRAGRDKATDDIRRDIGIATIQLRWVRDTLLVEGIAETEYDANRAVELCKIGLGVGTDNGAWRKVRLVDMLRVKPQKGGAKGAPKTRKTAKAPAPKQ